jgi:hypothetical protein
MKDLKMLIFWLSLAIIIISMLIIVKYNESKPIVIETVDYNKVKITLEKLEKLQTRNYNK